jgi:Ca2+-binding RTX toxin-like protein
MAKDSSLSKVMVVFLGVTLLGSSFTAYSGAVFAAAPGDFIDDFVSSGSGGLDKPKNLIFGPDGNLYVISYQQDKVKRYDGTTGAVIDTFVASGSGGLDEPQGLEFGPDGNLYVTSQSTHQVLRYDGASGIFMDVFVSNGLGFPQEAIFGPDGNLYVSNYFTDSVVRFDGTSGSLIDVFVIAGSGGLDAAQGLAFGPDGNLYVVSQNTDQVMRYDGTTGVFIDVFSSGGGLSTPKDLVFGSDGNLYVTSNSNDKVKRYDGTTGAVIDTFVASGSGGLDYPQGLEFGPDDALYVTSQNTDEVLRYEGPFGISATCNGITATIVGTISSEVIDGTSGDDVIVGLDGDDTINGMGGNDIICGNQGNDIITAGSGNDEIFGGTDDDTINAGDGNNYVEGNNGNDVINSGSGDDTVLGGNGIDAIDAGDGNNNVEGNNGNDVINSGSGDDLILGGNGDDCINSGGEAGDSIDGGSGTNLINTGSCLAPVVEEETTLICHFPPGNPGNHHDLMIAPSALLAHKSHGDKLGYCEDDEEKRIELLKIKKHREETKDKNELKEKRSELKEIKEVLNDLKKEFNDIEKQKIKNLVDEIKEVIKKLNENPEYDKEFKKILKDELKETTLKIKQEMTTKEKAFKHKIDSKIHSLSKSDNPQRDAKKLGFDFKNGKTKIVIKLSDDNPKVVDYLSSLGTLDIKNDKHIQLTVKVSDLPKLNSINGIDKIRQPFSAVQFYEELSEGVYFINADLAQFAGITGEGIKAAVLDLAFTDNEKISDNIVEVKSFRQGMGYMPIQGAEGEASHGTAVAEIITDVAPDVELYLYSMETDIEFITAVDEAITKEVDVIAMSAGWPNFPTDGTSHITQKIEEAVENGIVFVVPSGNFANKHWEGSFTDANFNNWHDYTDSDEGLSITVTQERITEEKPIVSYLMWDVGMADVADFEMVLVDPLGQIVDYSANEQKTKSDTQFEYIHHIPDTEGTYSIGILYAGDMSDVSKRPKASLEIFSVNDELERPISHSSVSVPADAEGAIVVGAVNHLDGTLEPFSSQGPTNNGKLAPHVLGPDGVTTLALGDKPFYGTSATTPYVAGLVALILQSNPDMSPEQVLNEIQENTDQSGLALENEYDYSSGYGLASAFFLVEDLEVIG